MGEVAAEAFAHPGRAHGAGGLPQREEDLRLQFALAATPGGSSVVGHLAPLSHGARAYRRCGVVGRAAALPVNFYSAVDSHGGCGCRTSDHRATVGALLVSPTSAAARPGLPPPTDAWGR
ncbi:hypothetical protein GCM10023347_33540 [Streptomyces chumphonensis]